MKCALIVIAFIFSNLLFGQHFYISLDGDTVSCEILREEPYFIKIKEDDNNRDRILAKEIKGYVSNNGVLMVSKRIINKNSKDSIVLLPAYGLNGKYLYNNYAGVSYITNNGVTFYELMSVHAPYSIGRKAFYENFLANDSVGLSQIKYLSDPDNEQQKLDAINSVYNYLASDKEIEKKLSVYQDYRNFTEKGLRKLIGQYMRVKFE